MMARTSVYICLSATCLYLAGCGSTKPFPVPEAPAHPVVDLGKILTEYTKPVTKKQVQVVKKPSTVQSEDTSQSSTEITVASPAEDKTSVTATVNNTSDDFDLGQIILDKRDWIYLLAAVLLLLLMRWYNGKTGLQSETLTKLQAVIEARLGWRHKLILWVFKWLPILKRFKKGK